MSPKKPKSRKKTRSSRSSSEKRTAKKRSSRDDGGKRSWKSKKKTARRGSDFKKIEGKKSFSWKITKDADDQNTKQMAEYLKKSPPTKKIPKRELVLDQWQADVLENLMEGNSVIVDAPTTAGKTLAIERFFENRITDPEFKAVYTTPIKSLANDKLLEFRALFGDKHIGIATGDIKENLDAPIIIATLECYRNSLI